MASRARYHYDLTELQRALLQLSTAVQQSIDRAVWAILRNDLGGARRAVGADDEIDERAKDIEERALHLIAVQQPLASDLRFLLATIRIADELERMGDYAEGIAKLVLRDAELPPSAPPAELRTLSEHVRQMLQASVQAFVARDADAAARLERDDDQVDTLTGEIQTAMLARIQSDPPTAARSLHYLFVAHNLERMADRAVNIAERSAFIVTGRAHVEHA